MRMGISLSCVSLSPNEPDSAPKGAGTRSRRIFQYFKYDLSIFWTVQALRCERTSSDVLPAGEQGFPSTGDAVALVLAVWLLREASLSPVTADVDSLETRWDGWAMVSWVMSPAMTVAFGRSA